MNFRHVDLPLYSLLFMVNQLSHFDKSVDGVECPLSCYKFNNAHTLNDMCYLI
jgi:hypothetical protein